MRGIVIAAKNYTWQIIIETFPEERELMENIR